MKGPPFIYFGGVQAVISYWTKLVSYVERLNNSSVVIWLLPESNSSAKTENFVFRDSLPRLMESTGPQNISPAFSKKKNCWELFF